MRLAPFREYVQVVRGMLRGEEVDYTLDGDRVRCASRCASTG